MALPAFQEVPVFALQDRKASMPVTMEREKTVSEVEAMHRVGSLPRRLQAVGKHPGEALAEVVSSITDRLKRRKPLTDEDTIWSVVGTGESVGSTDVSANKHTYLAEAMTPKAK